MTLNVPDSSGVVRPPGPAPSLWDRFVASPATWIIAGVNILVFIWAESSVGRTQDTRVLIRVGALERCLVWQGEYWRLVSAMFLHIGVIHLLWNVWALPSWCAVVERSVGTGRFLIAYFAAGIGASAVSAIGHHAVAAGASGAGFGMIGFVLVLLFAVRGSWKRFFEDPNVRNSLVMIAIWVALGFTIMNMDNFAHLGGLAFGILIGWRFVARPARPGTGIALWILVGAIWLGTVAWAVYPRLVHPDHVQELEEIKRGTSDEPDSPPRSRRPGP